MCSPKAYNSHLLRALNRTSMTPTPHCHIPTDHSPQAHPETQTPLPRAQLRAKSRGAPARRSVHVEDATAATGCTAGERVGMSSCSRRAPRRRSSCGHALSHRSTARLLPSGRRATWRAEPATSGCGWPQQATDRQATCLHTTKQAGCACIGTAADTGSCGGPRGCSRSCCERARPSLPAQPVPPA